MNKKTLILLTVSLVGTHTWAGSVTVPNTFVDGATASASEVNANFDAVKTAVDDNDSRITTNTTDINTNAANITANMNAISAAAPQVLLKDANGVYIGRVIGMASVSSPYVLTDQGYRTQFRIEKGMIYSKRSVFYESTDCTGDGYVDIGSPGTVFSPTSQDDLAYTAGAILYSPKDAQGVIIDTNSALSDNLDCVTSISNTEGYPAYQNDPNITGIQSTAYPTRMLIE